MDRDDLSPEDELAADDLDDMEAGDDVDDLEGIPGGTLSDEPGAGDLGTTPVTSGTGAVAGADPYEVEPGDLGTAGAASGLGRTGLEGADADSADLDEGEPEGRFSTGMEELPPTEEKEDQGRFSEGQEVEDRLEQELDDDDHGPLD